MIGVRAPRGRSPALASLAFVVVLGVGLAACGLGEKEAHADRIIDSVDRARESGAATGTLALSVRVLEAPPQAEAAAEALGDEAVEAFLGGGAGGPQRVSAGVTIDFSRERSELGFPERAQVFDDLVLFGLRRGAAPNEARPWVKLDVSELDAGAASLDLQENSALLLLNAIPPSLLVDLIAGGLTGSVEVVATEPVGGVETTRYGANFDVDKTMRDTRRSSYDEDRRETVETLFDLLNIDDTVHQGEVWIDEEGMPRRFVVHFEVRGGEQFKLEASVTLELVEFGVDVDVSPPSPDQVLEFDTLVGFLRTVGAPSASESGSDQPAGSDQPTVDEEAGP